VGGVATMILADFGADVTKLEPPGGDPFVTLAAAPMWLRGKRRRELDLKSDAGVTDLHALVSDADVVVTSYRPGVAAHLGADADTLRALNPALVYCAITGFGPRGPYSGYKGYEGVVAALSGRMMSFEGQPERPGPAYAAVQVAGHTVAQAAVHGMIAALLLRRRTGQGDVVETSLLQGMIPYDLAGLYTQQLMRNFPDHFPADANLALNRQPTLQYQPVRTRDGGWIQLGNLLEHLFHAFLGAADLSEIYADPRFTNAPQLTLEDREALREIILTRMQERTLAEWMETFIADGNVAAEPFATPEAGLSHPQLVHNGDVVTAIHPTLGPVTQLGPLARLHATPGVAAPFVPGAAPAAGSERSAASGEPAPRYPLEGVTVLELATIIAAPLGCVLLADLGARVIKVETLEGDGYRTMGQGAGAIKTNTGKESICINLRTAAGQEIVRRLAARADILVHNYRSGTPERLGIGFDDLHQLNPRLVYVNAVGYGVDGPYARRPSTHPVAGAATGGALWQAGAGTPPDGPLTLDEVREAGRRLTRANEVNPDPNSASVYATAALLGLYARETQGIGQRVDSNMFIANAYANSDDFLSYAGKPPRPPVDPEIYGLSALYRLYETAEGWVFLACVTDREWDALLQATGDERLATDPAFATRAQRQAHDAMLAAVLISVFRARTAAAWEAELAAVDVACVQAARSTPGVFWDQDAHVRANGFVVEASHPRWGTLRRHGPVVSLRGLPPRMGGASVAGDSTDAILRELGYDAAEVAALHTAGVVRQATAEES